MNNEPLTVVETIITASHAVVDIDTLDSMTDLELLWVDANHILADARVNADPTGRLDDQSRQRIHRRHLHTAGL